MSDKFFPRVFVVSGPSGVGKSTVIKKVLDRHSQTRLSVSSTTRPIREHEQDGVQYNFISRDKFIEGVLKNRFMEWARVFNNYYGTNRKNTEHLLNNGYHVLMDIDVRGAMNICDNYLNCVLIFIKPPSLDALYNRLISRGTESSRSVTYRISQAKKEIAHERRYDYVLVNRGIDETAEDILEIISKEQLEHKPIQLIPGRKNSYDLRNEYKKVLSARLEIELSEAIIPVVQQSMKSLSDTRLEHLLARALKSSILKNK